MIHLVVKLKIELFVGGADARLKNNLGESSIYLASSEGHTEILERILKNGKTRKGSSIQDDGKELRETPAVDCAGDDLTEPVEEWIVDSSFGLDKLTPLMASVVGDHLSSARLLIKVDCQLSFTSLVKALLCYVGACLGHNLSNPRPQTHYNKTKLKMKRFIS